jgi:hypothetical protein
VYTGVSVGGSLKSGLPAKPIRYAVGERMPNGQIAGVGPGARFAGESVPLQEYGGPGGGHHVPAKSTYTGALNPNKGLAISNSELARLGLDHGVISGAQNTLYRSFAKTGQKLTWQAVKEIETQALTRGGLDAASARATAQQGIQRLIDKGVTEPTRIPWSK